jgi:hypothetical protein
MSNNLSESKIKSLLEKDIPYVLNSMLAYDLMMHRKEKGINPELKESCYGDSPVIEPAFELGPIFGRSLLNFLGIASDNTYSEITPKKWRETDLRITWLGSNYHCCDIKHNIISENKIHLLTLLKIADKCIAHLTTVKSQEDDHPHLRPAKLAIHKLVLEHVHGLKHERIWWISQGPK